MHTILSILGRCVGAWRHVGGCQVPVGKPGVIIGPGRFMYWGRPPGGKKNRAG